jgi:hypothetical protein
MRLAPDRERTAAIVWLAALASALIGITIATPSAFRAGGDNVYMIMAILSGLLALAATRFAEQAPKPGALWLILGVAALLRMILLFTEPLLSTDIFRYVWDGTVQAAGINPYRFIPADPALAHLRDTAIFPNINRADYAATIYPPVAQMFYFVATRLGENATSMRFALLLCEAGSIGIMILLLSRLQQPATRIVAYAWHPLPLWEIANNGHIDGLMVLLLLIAIWFALAGRLTTGGIFVALAALVKPYAIVAMAAFWKPWNFILPVAALAIVAACYAPYLSVGWGVLGFLTTGYLSEEAFDSGGAVWPLAVWRLAAGTLPFDYYVYLGASAALLGAMAIAAIGRDPDNSDAVLGDIKRLLLAFLLLLSPSYPWYFLALTPFLALQGGPIVWAATLGALFLQEEVPWDPYMPILGRKTLLYGLVILACAYEFWRARIQRKGPTWNERSHRS